MTEPWEQIEHIIQRIELDDLVYEEMKKVPVDDDRSVDLLLAEFRAEKWRTTLVCVQALGRSTVRQTEIADRLLELLDNDEEMIRKALPPDRLRSHSCSWASGRSL